MSDRREATVAETIPEPKRDTLDATMRTIAEDARVEPESYLRETIVPEGGE